MIASVLLITRDLALAGSQRQLVTLAVALSERGLRVRVLCVHRRGPLETELRAAGIEVIGSAGRWGALSALIRGVGLRLRHRDDVVYGFLNLPNVLAWCLGRLVMRCPVVVGIRNAGFDPSDISRKSAVVNKVERHVWRRADAVVANSTEGAEMVSRAGVRSTHLHVVPNGIDSDRFDLGPEIRRQVRSRLDVAEDTVLVGRIGRVHPEKGMEEFIRVAASIARDRPYVHFLSIGYGEEAYVTRILASSTRLGLDERLTCLPASESIAELYQAMDLLVSTSRREGFPNVVAEAMSAGLAVVATDVGDTAAIIGGAGVVVPPGALDEITDAVGSLCDDPVARAELGALGRARVNRKFAVEQCTARTLAVFEMVAS